MAFGATETKQHVYVFTRQGAVRPCCIYSSPFNIDSLYNRSCGYTCIPIHSNCIGCNSMVVIVTGRVRD